MGSITTTTVPIPTHGKFRYVTKGTTPVGSTHLYHFPPLSAFGDVRSLPIRDIRSSLDLGDASPYKLDLQGFSARRYPTALASPPYTHASWNDEQLLKNVYIPEIEALLLQITGAKSIFTDILVMRNNIHTEVDNLARSEDAKAETNPPSEDANPIPAPESEFADFPKMIGVATGAGASPAPKVHLDYAPAGARAHIRKYHSQTARLAAPVISAEDRILAGGVSAEDLPQLYDGPRWAMFSVWRPLKTVRRDPLALSDCRTFPQSDYVTLNVMAPTAGGAGGEKTHPEESYLAYGSEEHEWHWISNQEVDEVLVIQLFDSKAEREGRGVAGGVMHSSVDIEGTEGEEARESLEVRCTVMW